MQQDDPAITLLIFIAGEIFVSIILLGIIAGRV